MRRALIDPRTLPRPVLFALAFAFAAVARADDPGAELKPMASGPVHEAFLSPRRDVAPPLVPKAPPAAVVERPAAAAPSPGARWIDGYWEWAPDSGGFVWVTGTWRVPPPGRTWIAGGWRRDGDGWRRDPGFWSDRPVDQIVFREDGPPDHRPPDDPGAPPRPNCFFIPGQFVLDGDRVEWREGFWTDARPGWAWVPAGWVRRPRGWLFQDGYWDRSLERRGTLFAPAEPVAEQVATAAGGRVERLDYSPRAEVGPELYGQLFGAFGRATPWYDGYPGVGYDADGRYYGYAGYGSLAPFYGYLDYPALGGYGFPYFASPIFYVNPTPPIASVNPIPPMAAVFPIRSLAFGLGPPYFGFGNSILPLMTGFPLFGANTAMGSGLGWGYPGWNPGTYSWGIPGWSGVALGTWPGFNWGTWGWSGPAIGAMPSLLNVGFPNWFTGWSNFGYNTLGPFPGEFGVAWGGNSIANGSYPFWNSGRREPTAPPRPGPERPPPRT